MKKRFLFIFALLLVVCSCGSPRTAVRVVNKADGSETNITIKQGNGGSTSVEVTPSVNSTIDSVRFNFANPLR